MTEPSALLPCPFCNRKLWYDADIEATRHAKIPYEDYCPLEGFLFASDRRDIIAAWNTRAHAQGEPVALDAARYQRLRILGCAPGYTAHLERGEVLRFTNLDQFVDADLAIQPSRGEAKSSAATAPAAGRTAAAGGARARAGSFPMRRR